MRKNAYRGNCAQCNESHNSNAFKTNRAGLPLPPVENRMLHFPHESPVNNRICNACCVRNRCLLRGRRQREEEEEEEALWRSERRQGPPEPGARGPATKRQKDKGSAPKPGGSSEAAKGNTVLQSKDATVAAAAAKREERRRREQQEADDELYAEAEREALQVEPEHAWRLVLQEDSDAGGGEDQIQTSSSRRRRRRDREEEEDEDQGGGGRGVKAPQPPPQQPPVKAKKVSIRDDDDDVPAAAKASAPLAVAGPKPAPKPGFAVKPCAVEARNDEEDDDAFAAPAKAATVTTLKAKADAPPVNKVARETHDDDVPAAAKASAPVAAAAGPKPASRPGFAVKRAAAKSAAAAAAAATATKRRADDEDDDFAAQAPAQKRGKAAPAKAKAKAQGKRRDAPPAEDDDFAAQAPAQKRGKVAPAAKGKRRDAPPAEDDDFAAQAPAQKRGKAAPAEAKGKKRKSAAVAVAAAAPKRGKTAKPKVKRKRSKAETAAATAAAAAASAGGARFEHYVAPFDPEPLASAMKADLGFHVLHRICALCSEVHHLSGLTSLVLDDRAIPAWAKLDQRGVRHKAPAHTCLYACSSCLSPRLVLSWSRVRFNVHGLGRLPTAFWWSEELCVATVSPFLRVVHAGHGGHANRQQSVGGMALVYHNVLNTIALILRVGAGREMLVVQRPQQGALRDTGWMLVRVRHVLHLFLLLWLTSRLYRSFCLQVAKAAQWDEATVFRDLVPHALERLEQLDDEVPFPGRERLGDETTTNTWPWFVDPDSWRGDVFVLDVQGSVGSYAGRDVELVVRCLPTLLSGVTTAARLQGLCADMTVEGLGRHLLLLNDNRVGRHDRAIFILNHLVVRWRIVTAMSLKVRRCEPLAELLAGLQNLEQLAAELRLDVDAQRAEMDRRRRRRQREEAGEDDDEEDDEEEDRPHVPLVELFFRAIKALTKDVKGHPFARYGDRLVLKAHHRHVDPVNVWLTTTVPDEGNVVLNLAYLVFDDDDDEAPPVVDLVAERPYATVKSGAVAQAVFHDAFTRALHDNVLVGPGPSGVFGAMSWAGSETEYCEDGKAHSHTPGSATAVAPETVARWIDADGPDDDLNKLEQWVGETFCERLRHDDDDDVVVPKVHEHGRICSKYRKPGDPATCRLNFPRPTSDAAAAAPAELVLVDLAEGGVGWLWKLHRDHGYVVPHSDKLHRVLAAVGLGLEGVNLYCQLLGGTADAGHKVIRYCTDYATKLGMSKLDLTELALRLVGLVLNVDAPWGAPQQQLILFVVRMFLSRSMQAAPVPQAQAAVNLLGLAELHLTTPHPAGYALVTLHATPLVDHAWRGRRAEAAAAAVLDYTLRGRPLEDFSPMRLRREGWVRKARKDGQQESDVRVPFLPAHPQHATHWLVQTTKGRAAAAAAAEAFGGGDDAGGRLAGQPWALLNMYRRAADVADEESRGRLALCLATPWREPRDLREGGWPAYAAAHRDDDPDVRTLLRLFELDRLNGLCRDAAAAVAADEPPHPGADTVQDPVRADDPAVPWGDELASEPPLTEGVGGDKGDRAAAVARRGGLVAGAAVVVERGPGSGGGDDAVAGAAASAAAAAAPPPPPQPQPVAPGFLLRSREWASAKSQAHVPAHSTRYVRRVDEEEEEEDEEGGGVPTVTPNRMNEILGDWMDAYADRLDACNASHLAALLPCIDYLADVFSKQPHTPFSLVVQGAGGTGKTATVVQGIRDFLNHAAGASGHGAWRRAALMLAPTNVAALAIGGRTLDSALYNRRSGGGGGGKGVSRFVRLIVIDEFSMVSPGFVAQIERGLRGGRRRPDDDDAPPFGGIPVVWLGDVHQLEPVGGGPLHKEDGSDGRRLWTGARWNPAERRSLAVLMTHQYRMRGPLRDIAERFTQGTMRLEDARAIAGRRMHGAEAAAAWADAVARNEVRVLCLDNDAKARLNLELERDQRARGVQGPILEWRCVDQDDNAGMEQLVVDQLEPTQWARPGQRVVSLENYYGTDVANGTPCVVVAAVVEDGDDDGSGMPEALLVASEDRAAELEGRVAREDRAAELDDDGGRQRPVRALAELVRQGVLVEMRPKTRDHRKGFPMSPVAAMTVNKAQGATLPRAVLYWGGGGGGHLTAHAVYMGISRVRTLEELHILGDAAIESVLLHLRFGDSVVAEMARLRALARSSTAVIKGCARRWPALRRLVDRIPDEAVAEPDEAEAAAAAEPALDPDEVLDEETMRGHTTQIHADDVSWLGPAPQRDAQLLERGSTLHACSALLAHLVEGGGNDPPPAPRTWSVRKLLDDLTPAQRVRFVRVDLLDRTLATNPVLGASALEHLESLKRQEREYRWRGTFGRSITFTDVKAQLQRDDDDDQDD